MDRIGLQSLVEIIGGTMQCPCSDQIVSTASIDSRRIGNSAVFFALRGVKTDGHRFVPDAFRNGAVAAVVNRPWHGTADGAVIEVDDTLAALQRLAAWWRGRLSGKMIAVTGSNGKTIVKDALLQAMQYSRIASGSLGSFNSQLGVPLSVVRVPQEVEFAVIEAGVSAPGEMDRLQAILQPDFGILTNIGLAHIAAFGSREAIAREKLKLFEGIGPDGWVLVPGGDDLIDSLVSSLECKVYRFGTRSEELPFVESREQTPEGTVLSVRFPDGRVYGVPVKTNSLELITDIEAAICAAHLLGVDGSDIAQALTGHTPAHTRMEIWRSPTGITLINDSCGSDPLSVQSALRTLAQMKQKGDRGIFVFGGMRELGEFERHEHVQIGSLAAQHGVDILVLVDGDGLQATREGFLAANPAGKVLRYGSTRDLADELKPQIHPGDTVLFKGPPGEGIDEAAREIIDAMAYNRLIVDVQALAENVSRFRRLVGPNTQILGMVKALAYGSDLIRVSQELQNLGLDWLGVSTADEGMLLRRAGVELPILVTLCTADEVEKVLRHHLVPALYSFNLVAPLAEAAKKSGRKLPIHLKVDTGMGRIGVMPEQLADLARQVEETGWLRIAGLMTHFACAEDPAEDEFTRLQIARFREAGDTLYRMGYPDIICHAAATGATARFPESHFDMVRIGIGLYGIYPGPAVEEHIQLDLAVSLVSRITEIRVLNAGSRVGYGGTFVVPHDGFRVGVIPMGYHDGLPRGLSNVGYVLVNGSPARVIGRISMDSAVIDLNGIPSAQIGSDALIDGQTPDQVLGPRMHMASRRIRPPGPRSLPQGGRSSPR